MGKSMMVHGLIEMSMHGIYVVQIRVISNIVTYMMVTLI